MRRESVWERERERGREGVWKIEGARGEGEGRRST